MASLTNTKISDTYPLLLKIETNGVDGTLRTIEDGDGTASALKISSGAIQVDNIKIDGNAITSTDSNGNIDLTPDGSGEVNISKVDIDSGAIDGTSIGANSANTGAFTTLTASGDVNFDSNTLFVDASANAVGIGTSSPEAVLTTTPESGNFNSTYNNYDGVGLFLRGNGTSGDGNYGPALVFGSADSDVLNQENKHSAISLVQTGSDPNQTGLAFWTHSSVTSTDALVESMRISSDGKVGIGTDSPDSILHIKGGADWRPIFKIENTSTGNESGILQFHKVASDSSEADNDYLGGIEFHGINSNNDSHRFAYMYGISSDVTDGTEDGRIDFMTAKAGTDTITMTLKSGNVGIGTTSPAVTTHIHSDAETFAYVTTDSDVHDTGIWFGHDIDGNPAYTGIVYDRSVYKLKLFNANSIANHLVIDNEGKVGIGTDSFSSYNSNADNLVIHETGDFTGITLSADNDQGSNIYFADPQDDNVGGITYNHTSNYMNFRVNGAERMRITSGGRLGINRTSPNAKLHIHETVSGQELIFLNHSVTGANQTYIQFRHDGTQRGNIQVNDSNDQIVYNTTVSDKRLKKDFEDWDESILPAFKSLKPQLFNFKNSENKSGKTKGYIAQDNVEEFPEAYTVSKVLDDDDTEYYSFNPSGMVAYLMKAVKELTEKVEALENA